MSRVKYRADCFPLYNPPEGGEPEGDFTRKHDSTVLYWTSNTQGFPNSHSDWVARSRKWTDIWVYLVILPNAIRETRMDGPAWPVLYGNKVTPKYTGKKSFKTAFVDMGWISVGTNFGGICSWQSPLTLGVSIELFRFTTFALWVNFGVLISWAVENIRRRRLLEELQNTDFSWLMKRCLHCFLLHRNDSSTFSRKRSAVLSVFMTIRSMSNFRWIHLTKTNCTNYLGRIASWPRSSNSWRAPTIFEFCHHFSRLVKWGRSLKTLNSREADFSLNRIYNNSISFAGDRS